MKCGIIKDLLPSYIDGLTSEESNSEIGKHLKSCNGCRECYREMSRKEFELSESEEETQKELLVLKSFKRFRRRMISGVCIAVAAVVLVICFINFYPVPVSYEKTRVDVFLTGPVIDRIRVMGSENDTIEMHELVRGLEIWVPEGGVSFQSIDYREKSILVDGESQEVVFIGCQSTPVYRISMEKEVEAGYESGQEVDPVPQGNGIYTLGPKGEIPISEFDKVYYLDCSMKKIDRASDEEILQIIEKYGHLVWTKEDGNQSTYYNKLLWAD